MRIDFDSDDLTPLVRRVVSEVLEQTAADDARFAGRLSLNEQQAAEALGIAPHALRDCRGRGEIVASKCGARIVYSVDELRAFLRRQQQ